MNCHLIKQDYSNGYELLAAAVVKEAYVSMERAFRNFIAFVNPDEVLTAEGRKRKKELGRFTIERVTDDLRREKRPFTSGHICKFLITDDVDCDAFVSVARRRIVKKYLTAKKAPDVKWITDIGATR